MICLCFAFAAFAIQARREAKPARAGAANAWASLSADIERGLIFVPTSSPSPDFYGGERPGDNRYANSIVALRAATGAVVWHYQLAHHDLWDYDLPAQPAPTLPRALVPQRLDPNDAWGALPSDRAWRREQISALRNEGLYTPPSLKGTLAFPSSVGGVNWSGMSYDPERGLLITNTNRIALVVKLIPRAEFAQRRAASSKPMGEFAGQEGTPYGMYREPLLSPHGTPCNPPPWGVLTAVDLNTGAVRWDVPLGAVTQVGALEQLVLMRSKRSLGSPNMGGSITTASGLIFIGAGMDPILRAFDIETGCELWRSELPACANATPMTYQINGRQLVVVAAGGHGKLGSKLGDAVVAFTLP